MIREIFPAFLKYFMQRDTIRAVSPILDRYDSIIFFKFYKILKLLLLMQSFNNMIELFYRNVG